MSLVVSLDVLPADLPVSDVVAMVDACSEALSVGRCALAADLPESASPAAVALVLTRWRSRWSVPGVMLACAGIGWLLPMA